MTDIEFRLLVLRTLIHLLYNMPPLALREVITQPQGQKDLLNELRSEIARLHQDGGEKDA